MGTEGSLCFVQDSKGQGRIRRSFRRGTGKDYWWPNGDGLGRGLKTSYEAMVVTVLLSLKTW